MDFVPHMEGTTMEEAVFWLDAPTDADFEAAWDVLEFKLWG